MIELLFFNLLLHFSVNLEDFCSKVSLLNLLLYILDILLYFITFLFLNLFLLVFKLKIVHNRVHFFLNKQFNIKDIELFYTNILYYDSLLVSFPFINHILEINILQVQIHNIFLNGLESLINKTLRHIFHFNILLLNFLQVI